MRPEILIVALLLAGCAGQPVVPEPVQVGEVQGLVLDALLRPIPGATVTVDDAVVPVGENGAYAIQTNWTVGEHLLVFQAPGHVPITRAIEASSPAQRFWVNATLAPVATGSLETLAFDGHLACAAIAQVGHSHGNGDPDEDSHMDCAVTGRSTQTFTLDPVNDPNDLLLEVFWQANNQHAERLTMVLRDDEGHVISFDEGASPLRMHFGRGQIEQAFADDRSVTVQILPGIPEDSPAEVYIGLHIEQPFSLFATLGHGIHVPNDHSVDAA